MTTTAPEKRGGIRAEVARMKREGCISAAAECFYERGYENTTLDAVADRLGVTKPFIYSYFSSKGELLAEISSRGIRSSLDALEAALATDSRPRDKLYDACRAFTEAVLNNQMHIAIFAREEKNLALENLEQINAMRRQFDSRLTDLLVRGTESGDFAIEDAHLTALAVGGMVSWAYVWYRPGGRLSAKAIGEDFAQMILRMVGAVQNPD